MTKNTIRRIVAMILIIISIAAITLPASAEQERYITSNGNGRVNIRKGPGKDFPVAFQLEEGTKVIWLNSYLCGPTGWEEIKMSRESQEIYYVKTQYITPYPPSSGDLQKKADKRYGSTNLKRGSTGSYVRQLQKDLQAMNYSLSVDGDFGKITEKAVKAFQKKHGLSQDGIVGPKTRLKLYKVYMGIN